MLGNFTLTLPTRVHFGDEALDALPEELARYGNRVLLTYGGKSAKATGLYDRVIAALADAGKEVREVSGITANPTFTKVLEVAHAIREHDADLVLAVGGGSVIDCSKDASALAWQEGTPDELWARFYYDGEQVAPEDRVTPVGCILTIPATGSEMNRSGVTTNEETREKLEMVGDEVRTIPEFALLDPTLTYTLPRYQMVSGCYDILCHCMEQYFSGDDDCVSDYLAEGVMRAIISATNAAVADPMDYEARSNIMWCATWGLNGVIGIGKDQDWQLHDLGQSISAFTGATHGMTLSALTKAYYRHVLPAGMHRFARFATAVWGIPAEGRTDEELATAGLDALDAWLRGIGCVMNITELGVTEDMLEGIAAVTPLEESGYHPFTTEEFVEVLRESL